MKLSRGMALALIATASLFASFVAAPASASVAGSARSGGVVAQSVGQAGPLTTTDCTILANLPYSYGGRIWASGNVGNCNRTWKHACVVLMAIYPGYGGIPLAQGCIDINQDSSPVLQLVQTSWGCPGDTGAYGDHVYAYDAGWHIVRTEISHSVAISC